MMPPSAMTPSPSSKSPSFPSSVPGVTMLAVILLIPLTWPLMGRTPLTYPTCHSFSNPSIVGRFYASRIFEKIQQEMGVDDCR